MIRRRILSVAFSVLFMLSLTTPALATTTINFWYSDETSVKYTPYDGSYYVYNLSTDSTFGTYFRAAVSHAAAQWSAVLPIGVSETSFNYALNYVYGGTRSQLLDTFPDLSTDFSGLTYTLPSGQSTTITYMGSPRTVSALQAGNRMCIVEISGRTANGYKKTATHEMGHLFGWDGHSPLETDVMYGTASEITSLTSRDKTHLKQIYDLFY